MASADVISYLEALQVQHVASSPSLGEKLGRLLTFFRKREWHQFTDVLEEIVTEPVALTPPFLVDLYNKCVIHNEKRLNQLRLVKFLAFVMKQLPDVKARLEFTAATIPKVSLKDHPDANISVRALHLEGLVQSGDLAAAKPEVEQLEQDLLSRVGIDPSVYARFYAVKCLYHKTQNQLSEFYHSGFQYLAYQPLDGIPLPEQRDLAFSLAIATLVEERLFNFGELLLNPVIASLEDSCCWMVELLRVFYTGDITGYINVCEKYKDNLNSQPALVSNFQMLREKMSIMALVCYSFRQPGGSKLLPFDVIARETQLALDDVELMVMKAMSLNLIRGTIDQIDQNVTVTWVQPRHLGMDQLRAMQQQLGCWAEKVRETAALLEQETKDLTV
eukprot:CAMPEP_0177660954 /NCGR_PEP_ID=MMETSP0447-20121125/18362_1 /TAXON_ID=0 /ORGANISM="Stygamoeba regulata, Strain BSH-02190019" /LENGTH=388 /DNA_ID=CAMNT_0019166147 /DNA_START=55 /DNA_END=1218 /DNA_ORIENTATION=+